MNDKSQENDTAQRPMQVSGESDHEQPRCSAGAPHVETLEPQSASTRGPDGDVADPSAVDERDAEAPSDTDGSGTDVGFAAQDIMDWLTDFNRRFGDTIDDAAGNASGTDEASEVGEAAPLCLHDAEDQLPETVEEAVASTEMDRTDDDGVGTVCSTDEDDLNVVEVAAVPDQGPNVATTPSDAVAVEEIPADATMLIASEVFTEVPVPVAPQDAGQSIVGRGDDPGESQVSASDDDAGASPCDASGEPECHERHRRIGFFARLWARLRGDSRRASRKDDT